MEDKNSKAETKYSRRTVIASMVKFFGVFALSPISGVSAKLLESENAKTEHENKIYDCLILGGGISGMTAANALAFPRSANENQINLLPRSVLVLEVQGRLGGRVLTRLAKGFPDSVEMGAQYVHVDDKKSAQGKRYSLWSAFDEYGIKTTPIHRLFCGVAYSKYFSKLRKHWAIVFELPLNWLFNFRSDIANYHGPDMSIRQWLDKKPSAKNLPYGLKEKPIADIYLSGAASGRLEEMSLQGFNLDRFSSLDEGDYEYKVNSGWSHFVEKLTGPLSKFVKNPFSGNKIPVKYHSQVTKIEYDKHHVTVTVRESQDALPGPTWQQAAVTEKVYRAKTAILTFPIGILRRAVGIDPKSQNDVLEFSPALPWKKINAMKAIGVGVAAKLFIVFESRFWDEDVGIINRIDGMSTMGRTYFVPNYGNEKTNVVLGAYLGGAEAHRIVEWSEEQILKSVCEELGHIFYEANKEIKIYDRVKVDAEGSKVYTFKNWALDPWAYGNDSFLVFDSTDSVISHVMPSARKDLASPELTGALHWAGEATIYNDGNEELYAPSHAGVTHGAHTSGLRAAKEVADYLDQRKNRS